MKPLVTLPPALRHRRFAMLWLGMLISVAGSQMQLWSLFWHIRTLTDQPAAVSGIGAARVIPVVAFSLVAGVVADRFNRRKLLFLTQSILAGVAVCLSLLTWSGEIQLWHIYLLTAVQASAQAFDQPARQSLVPNLVPRADLANAFSVQSIAFDLGSIFGPMLSGLVIASLGLQAVYLINAISFGAVILALIFMGPVAQTGTPETNGERRAVSWAAIKEGIQYILHQPIILSSMLLDFWATFFSSANTLLPFVAIDILHVGEVEYGWLSATQSIGAVSAALVISQRHGLRRQGSLLLGAVMLFGAATILFGVSRVFWLTMLALVLVGAADSVSTILRNTIRQIQTPDHLRGRMVSVNQIFFMGGPQLGEIESGLVAQAFGVPAAIISGGVGCILAAGWIGARWKQLRRYDGAEHASVPAPVS